MLVVDCLSGLGVLGAVQLCGVLSVDSVAASEQYVSSSIPDREGWPPEPGPGPDTTTHTSDTCTKVSQCSAVARRGGGSRKEENIMSCGM